MYRSKPVVKIIADSYSSENNVRLTTFELEYWRAILPELNTHRAFSRCTTSNRAMPTTKLIDTIKLNPWGPNHFYKNCKGMQGMEEYDYTMSETLFKGMFNQCAVTTVALVETIIQRLKDYNLDLHKQTINRILEPYQSVKTVLTADQFALEHFFKLRCAKDAQPEMRDLAVKMQEVYEDNTPANLNTGDIHCPYVSKDEYNEYVGKDSDSLDRIMDVLKASAMRCARVSYDKLDGTKASIEDDALSCEDKLIKNGHMSPLEMPCVIQGNFWKNLAEQYLNTLGSNYNNTTNLCFPFVQLRKLVEANKTYKDIID